MKTVNANERRTRLEAARVEYLEAVNAAALALAIGATTIRTTRRSGVRGGLVERRAVEGLITAADDFEAARARMANVELALMAGGGG